MKSIKMIESWLMLLLLLTTKMSIAQQAKNTNTPSPENIKVEITGELKKWHKITLTFDGPETSEMDKLNPFMAYRFDVYFTHKESGKTLKCLVILLPMATRGKPLLPRAINGVFI
jgi:hypothetical protein